MSLPLTQVVNRHSDAKLNDIELSNFLIPERVEVQWQMSSKKRLLESIASLLTKGNAGLDKKTIFQILTERERLGSTGIGKGVALPHGRVNSLDQVIGAFAVLDSPLDYEAVDKQPVNLVFALLVPAEANEEHLRILAHLAKLFNEPELRKKLKTTRSAAEAYRILTDWKF